MNKDFRKAVKGTKPIKQSNRYPLSSQKIKRKAFKDDNAFIDVDQVNEYFYDSLADELVGFEETIEFKQASISNQEMQALKTGKIAIEEHLDLHGLSIEQARTEIGNFLHYASIQQIRFIRLIHGKGYRKEQKYPVLKNKVNAWLRQHPDVLAFHSALAKDGGTGAVYVWIKNQYKA